jgi:hypothetical protein
MENETTAAKVLPNRTLLTLLCHAIPHSAASASSSDHFLLLVAFGGGVVFLVADPCVALRILLCILSHYLFLGYAFPGRGHASRARMGDIFSGSLGRDICCTCWKN